MAMTDSMVKLAMIYSLAEMVMTILAVLMERILSMAIKAMIL
jgi:hypothetical protein